MTVDWRVKNNNNKKLLKKIDCNTNLFQGQTIDVPNLQYYFHCHFF